MSDLDSHTSDSAGLLQEIIESIPVKSHIRVHACYHLVVLEHWKFDNRINSDFHMIFIKAGKGFYRVGDSHIPFEKGMIILVSRGMVHSAGQDASYPPFIIPVRFGFYENSTGEPSDFHSQPFGLVFTPKDVQEFQLLFEKVHEYNQKAGQHYSNYLCGTLVSEILLKMYVELMDRRAESTFDARIEKLKRFMDENPYHRCNPLVFAEMAELSEKYCRSMFKKQYGLTPMEYQTKARMEYARFLIAESGQNVKNVAVSLGYPDPYSFSKQFKKIMGYPPAQLKMKKI